MSTQYTTPFREFITRDDQGRYHVRLGPQTFSTNYKLTDIRLETENGGTPVDPEYLKANLGFFAIYSKKLISNVKKNVKQCMQKTAFNARHIAQINVLHTTTQSRIKD
jgi:hypothetical protein